MALSFLPSDQGLLPKWLFFVSSCASLHKRNNTPNPSCALPRSPKRTSDTPPQVALVSIGNSIQSYATLRYTQRIYSRATVTPLQGRTFGTWTALTALVRAYAAYHITEPAWYQLAMVTYAVAGWHFFSEWFYFKTTQWGAPLAGPAFISVGSLVWMVSQWSWYVR